MSDSSDLDPGLADRLAALDAYGILDTLPEAGFEDIVHLAAHLCQTPVALVSLVDRDRQWFKARVGFEACETPLTQSVCRHALASRDLLVITDLTADPRTRENTLVTGAPFMRFYAGAPLITPKGVVIGTLCVIDIRPRPAGLTTQQAEMLQALARQVISQLELRKAAADISQAAIEHKAERERSLQAEEAGGIGTFELDIASGAMQVSPEYCRIFGLAPGGTYHASDSERLVLAEDGEQVSNHQRRRSGTAALQAEYRIRRGDTGDLRWIARQASFDLGADGRPVSMFGTVQDVTERKRALEQQTRLLALGDALRGATGSRDVIELAARTLGEVLGVDRAGYARIAGKGDAFLVEADWTSPGHASIAGEHPIGHFETTMMHLGRGETIAISDMPSAAWLGADLITYAQNQTMAMIDIPLIDNGKLVGIAYAHQGRRRVWRKDEIDFAHGVADRTYAALATLDAEANQRLLNRELGHRMKNQLALVMAIVSQTLRTATDMATAREVLSARIQVLAGAHDLLIAGNAGRSSVAEIVSQVLRLHDNVLSSRFVIEGPPLPIASRPALSLSLMLHELSTNAAKYGALSTEHGQVTIDWTVQDDGGNGRFTLRWTEHGGPPLAGQPSRGSGTRLIQAGLSGTLDCAVSLDYRPEGLCCTVTADAVSLQTER